MTKDKLFKKRIRHLKTAATLLQLTPFLRCIMLNGSLAEGRIRRSSDIDLLLIAKNGRIFTARFFASILVWLTGLRRSSNEDKDHNGKFCLNYYLTESHLTVPMGRGRKVDEYCAKNYSKSLMVWGKRDIFFSFMETNRRNWEKYLKNNSDNNRRKMLKRSFPIRTFHAGGRLRNFVEKMLGDGIENYLKKLQLRKINIDQCYVVANDKELRFHSPK